MRLFKRLFSPRRSGVSSSRLTNMYMSEVQQTRNRIRSNRERV